MLISQASSRSHKIEQVEGQLQRVKSGYEIDIRGGRKRKRGLLLFETFSILAYCLYTLDSQAIDLPEKQKHGQKV